jgi:iron complex transport system permease protein
VAYDSKHTNAQGASASEKSAARGLSYTSDQIARTLDGTRLPRSAFRTGGAVAHRLTMRDTNRLYYQEKHAETARVAVCIAVLLVLIYFSLCFTGAAGQYYAYSEAYTFYTPAEVANAIFQHIYNGVADLTHAFDARSNVWLLENCDGYWAIAHRAGVVGITLICAVLLSVSGMLYQNVFRNPLAGPNMLGASSGVSLGVMVLVAMYGSAAVSMTQQRYELCYGIGAAILIVVILIGKKLSGRGKPFDIVTMLLIGSILGQLIGFVVSYVTLFVMDDEDYQVYYTISQMLTVDTSLVSWIALGIAAVASIVPIYLLRFRMNALAFEEEDVKLLGVNYTRLRAIALVCGAIMILAAQIHTGMVGMITLLVPFLSRNWFGCEFTKQFSGNVCIGMILLLVCRDITDAIPFVGDGLAISSIVALAAIPLFILIVTRDMRGWE